MIVASDLETLVDSLMDTLVDLLSLAGFATDLLSLTEIDVLSEMEVETETEVERDVETLRLADLDQNCEASALVMVVAGATRHLKLAELLLL